jgi:pilus assembly protein Flp/PilA
MARHAPDDAVNAGVLTTRTRRTPMLKNLTKLWKDEQGATAVEYGLLVAAIAGVIITIVVKLGGTINTKFTAVNSAMP